MTAPVIIEAALNGITSRAHNPRVPVQPDELARDAVACVDAGATIVHTHAHNLGAPVDELVQAYADCYEPVLAARPGTVLYPTVGLGTSAAARHQHAIELATSGLIRQTFVDPGSVNLGGAEPDGLPPPIDYVYTNSFLDIRYGFDLCVRHDLGASIAVFEPGFLQVVLAYHEAGALPPGTLVKLYFAAGGYLTRGRALWGVPPITEGLDLYTAMLGDTGIPWAVALIDGDAVGHPLVRDALERGAHLRVGLEDQPDGPHNAEIVAAAAALCADVGRPVATPADTERLLGLGAHGDA
ncbi:MAG: 3-keto-5-aminohexanoate cleavage protein [Acidimicrobiia bacterium]|nr:3-keto-5-aminohexanoate cleavage protein [Acidimicrobiia bacterium]